MLTSPLPSSFLESYNLSVSFRCKALCMIINFLVYWSVSEFLPSILRMVLSIFQGELLRSLFVWWEFYSRAWSRSIFIIITIILHSASFSPTVCAGGLSLELEWHKVSSGFLYSSEYSSWSQQLLLSGLSRFFHRSPTVLILFPSQVHQLQLVSQSPVCSTVLFFLVLWQGPSICLSFHFLLYSLSGSLER